MLSRVINRAVDMVINRLIAVNFRSKRIVSSRTDANITMRYPIPRPTAGRFDSEAHYYSEKHEFHTVVEHSIKIDH